MNTRISDYEHELGKAQTVQELDAVLHNIHYDPMLNDTARAFLFENHLNTLHLPDEYSRWDQVHDALLALGE